MKKILIALLGLIVYVSSFSIGVSLKGGLNLEGALGEDEDASQQNYAAFIEITQDLGNFEFGIGAGYEDALVDEDTEVESLNYIIPAYAIAKLSLFQEGISPYLIAKGGYNFTEVADETKDPLIANPGIKDFSVEAGLFYAVGAGIEIGNFSMEGLYSVSEFETIITNIIDEESSDDTEYSRISVNLGYKLNFGN